MKNNILIIIGLFFITNVMAQFPAQQHLFRNVPQSQYLNPGAFPEYSGHFGIPALSNIAVTGSNSGFAFNDFFVNDSTLSLSKMTAGLSEKNYLNFGFSLEALTFGFKVKKNYFSFNFTPKIDVNFGYNKNLMSFIADGNAAHIGKTMSFDGTGFDISAYNEMAIGYSREINDKLAVGGRFKFLLGIANVSGDFDGVSLYTDPDNYALTANSTFSINQYGSHLFDEEIADSLGASTINFNNVGFGVDFGGSYKFSDKLSVYANVVDLGYIKWSDYGEKWENKGTSFTYDGMELSDLMGSDDEDPNTGNPDPNEEEESNTDQLLDSITDIFALEKESISYRTQLKSKLFIGANYKLNKFFDADALIYGRFFNGTFYPSTMVGLGFNVGKAITIKGTYAATNQSYDNVGAGIVLKAGAFQIYGMLDNVLGLSQLDYAKNLTGSFGINLVFTKDEDEVKKEKKEKVENVLNSNDAKIDTAVQAITSDSLVTDSVIAPLPQKDSVQSPVDSLVNPKSSMDSVVTPEPAIQEELKPEEAKEEKKEGSTPEESKSEEAKEEKKEESTSEESKSEEAKEEKKEVVKEQVQVVAPVVSQIDSVVSSKVDAIQSTTIDSLSLPQNDSLNVAPKSDSVSVDLPLNTPVKIDSIIPVKKVEVQPIDSNVVPVQSKELAPKVNFAE